MDMIEAGMDTARINMAYTPFEKLGEIVSNIRFASQQMEK
jgi:pyruvate kinase